MARERGYLWALMGPFFHLPGFATVVFAGLLVGMFVTVGGIIYGIVPLALLGVLVMVVWVVLLLALTLLTDEVLERLDRDNEPYPDDMGDRYLWDLDRGRPTPRGRALLFGRGQARAGTPRSPEPGRCPQCGGTLFIGRPNCPHCGTPVDPRHPGVP
jgi:hypothetical protein